MDFVNTDEAAKILKKSPRRVRQLIDEGKIKAEQFGGSYMVRRADLAKVSFRKPGRPKKK